MHYYYRCYYSSVVMIVLPSRTSYCVNVEQQHFTYICSCKNSTVPTGTENNDKPKNPMVSTVDYRYGTLARRIWKGPNFYCSKHPDVKRAQAAIGARGELK